MDTRHQALDDLIAFRTCTGFLVTPVENIILCKADGNYTEIALVGNERKIVTHNLKCVLQKMPAELFLRVHNSFAVNILHIKQVVNNGQTTLCLSEGERVMVSHRKKRCLLDLFEKMMNAYT